MVVDGHLADICRRLLDDVGNRPASEPVCLAGHFRRIFRIHRTPGLQKTLNIVSCLGIRAEAVNYLPTSAVNMTVENRWHINYSAVDRPATQKFSIYHELFEILDKTFCEVDKSHNPLAEPRLSRCADRFAGAVLLPPEFFTRQILESGCDIVKLGDEIELSHQCLLIGLAEHLKPLPLVGALYEWDPPGFPALQARTTDFVPTTVVRTPSVREVLPLGPRQKMPVRDVRPYRGGPLCTAITSMRPVLWHDSVNDRNPLILVRPLRTGLHTHRILLLALPGRERTLLQPQIDRIKPFELHGDEACPLVGIYPQCDRCNGL
ncbi:MAG: ImmA/IrrE family metallo-endopeptidase [Dehalococcoidia bacterium]|nr:ImmA/IrrE family metallo-endopeptidase [Dehalococcoidia bacterium]